MMVRVSVSGSSFKCDYVLKAEVNKMLLSRINKKAPMKIIIFSPQGNIHRKNSGGH